jgi:acetoacetate decarboxylase
MTFPISMPWSAPAFSRPPHAWKGVGMAVFPFTPRPEALRKVLPPGIEPAEGQGMITMLCYPQSEIHPFNELVVLVPVRVGATRGNYVPYIYVTTDEALIAGREIAGFPKLIADVRWERDGGRFRGSATRWGQEILRLEGNIDAPLPPELAVAQGQASRAPTINYKLIPGPGGEIEVEEITAVDLELEPRAAEIGRGRVRCDPSAHDPLAELVPESEGPLIMLLSDNTIPPGRVLQRIERKEQAA